MRRIPRTFLISGLTLLLSGSVAAQAAAQIRARIYVTGFSAPVAFVQDPVDRAAQYVVEQGGRIRVVRHAAIVPTDFLDLRQSTRAEGERGLLGLAFAPDHATSGRFYVNFTNLNGHTVVARFRRLGNSFGADATSRFDLRWGGANAPALIAQPFANHNGGHLAFGPDGFLYIGLGDGGSGNDPDHRAQNPAELLGKMLRVDVNVPDDHPIGYQIPADNPFIDSNPVAARHEIWSFGCRNPWRYNFDDPARGGSGALLIGDVGQNRFEEIDYEPPGQGGRNYGWRNREGAHDNITSRPPAYGPLIEPIHEYGRDMGQTVTGGYVYRGRLLGPSYVGRYFFADFVQGRVWSLALTIDPATAEARASDVRDHTSELAIGGPLGNISSFGVDSDGEMYLVDYSAGRILKMVGPAAPPGAPTGLRIIR